MTKFSATVDKWVLATEKRQEAVFRQSAQAVVEVMQKGVPVKDGFLRASMVVQVNMPLPVANQVGFGGSAPNYQMTLASAAVGDYITAGYTAVYGPRLEFGFVGQDALGRSYSQPPRGWVRAAAMQWPQIVNRVVADLKARAR